MSRNSVESTSRRLLVCSLITYIRTAAAPPCGRTKVQAEFTVLVRPFEPRDRFLDRRSTFSSRHRLFERGYGTAQLEELRARDVLYIYIAYLHQLKVGLLRVRMRASLCSYGISCV